MSVFLQKNSDSIIKKFHFYFKMNTKNEYLF